MPLVIAVIIIIGLFVIFKDKSGSQDARAKNEAASRRKTNAKLEQSILDGHMKHGLSFNEAFTATQKDVVSAGYEPCIPKDKYKNPHATTSETSMCDRCEKYDSFIVKTRRSDFNRLYASSYDEAERQIKCEEYIYNNFPNDSYEYNKWLRHSLFLKKIILPESYITYPFLGTCEIINFHINANGCSGRYEVRVLETGAINTIIPIGDKKITRL